MAICTKCANQFACTPNATCWCMQYPNVLQAPAEACVCANCLLPLIIEKIESITQSISIEDALNNNPYKDLTKSNELIEGIDYYVENGFFVFTKWYHLKRGYCCKNGCKHCAYGFTKT